MKTRNGRLSNAEIEVTLKLLRRARAHYQLVVYDDGTGSGYEPESVAENGGVQINLGRDPVVAMQMADGGGWTKTAERRAIPAKRRRWHE